MSKDIRVIRAAAELRLSFAGPLSRTKEWHGRGSQVPDDTMSPAQCPDVDCHLSDLLYTGGKRFCDEARISVILDKT